MTPVPLGSVEETAAELLACLRRIKGRDAARDPALEIAADQAAELAHEHRAMLVCVVEHPEADPALLVAWLVATRLDDDAAGYLADAGGADIREVTEARTATGYPVVIAERISIGGAQLQVVVADPERPRLAVFTLTSPTGRGWLELAGVAGRLVTGMEFGEPGPGPAPGTREAYDRRPRGTPARSVPR
jgi:hypothetical protein